MSEPPTDTTEDTRLSGPQALGAVIREAREARGLTLPQLGALLKIDNTRLRWMEEGRFADFRQPVFVRGYLRACARHLGLDERELLAQFDALFPNTEILQANTPKRRPPPPLQHGNRAIKISVLGFVIVLLGLWLALGGGAAQLSSSITGVEGLPFVLKSKLSADTTVANALNDRTAVQSPRDVQREPARYTDVSPAIPVSRSGPAVVVPLMAGEDRPGAGEAAVALESRQTEAATDGDDPMDPSEEARLVLEFSGECWVEIRNGERVLHANMQRAGDRVQLAEVPPYQVLLGDARWVSVTYNGDSVPVVAAEGTNTARLTIGGEL